MHISTRIYKFVLLALIVLMVCPAAFAYAATMGVASTNTSVAVGRTIQVNVTLDTQGESANAVSGQITFPPGLFTLQGINDGASPISLWIESPHEVVSGTVQFSGIVPGGMTTADPLLGLVLTAVAPGAGVIGLSNTALLENDGKGTPIPVVATGMSISVTSAPANANGAGAQGAVYPYTVPETFTPVITQSPDIYGGEYFLVLSTTDKGSGMAYYEVFETPAGTPLGQNPSWTMASSPYLLQDQTLSSDIYVRAVNNAGNAIIVKVPARHQPPFWAWSWEAIIAAVIGMIVIAAAFIFRRYRR